MLSKMKKILYATDLSKNSAYALSYAVNSAKQHNAEMVILHVMEVLDSATQSLVLTYANLNFEEKVAYAKKRIEKRLKLFFNKVREKEPEISDVNIAIEICQGSPVEEILRKADELDCDGIFMGTHNKGFISQIFFGSIAKMVLRQTRKPVFIIPLPKEEFELTVHDV